MYIAYKSVAARGLYGCGSLSPSYASLTRGYALSEISTLISAPDYVRYGPHASHGPKQALNPADIFSNCSSIKYNRSSYNRHCYPSLVYPHGLQDADPAWRGCTDTLKGNQLIVLDPPRVLTPVDALGPITAKETAPLGVMSASPAMILSSPLVTKTDSPKALASGSLSVFDPQQTSTINMDLASVLNVNTKTEHLTAKKSSFSVGHGFISGIGSDTRDLTLEGTRKTIIVKPQSLSDFRGHSDATKVLEADSVVFQQISKNPDARSTNPTVVATSLAVDGARSDSNHPGALGALASMMLSAFQTLHFSIREPFQPTRDTNHGFSVVQTKDSLPSESGTNIPSQTINAPAEPLAISFAVIDQGGLSLDGTAHRSGLVVIAGSTLKAGATALPIQGHMVSVDPAASKLIVDDQTLVIPTLPAEAKSGVTASQAHPSSSRFTSNMAQASSPQPRFIINGQAITRGGESATFSGISVGLDADENLIIGTSTIQGDQSPSFLHRHGTLTVGSLTLTIGVTDQDEAYTRDGPARTSRQAVIGSQTYSASSRLDDVAIAGGTMPDKPSAQTESASASTSGSKGTPTRPTSIAPEPSSNSKSYDKIKASASESISAACSSCSTTPTSETCEVNTFSRLLFISTLTLFYLILT